MNSVTLLLWIAGMVMTIFVCVLAYLAHKDDKRDNILDYTDE